MSQQPSKRQLKKQKQLEKRRITQENQQKLQTHKQQQKQQQQLQTHKQQQKQQQQQKPKQHKHQNQNQKQNKQHKHQNQNEPENVPEHFPEIDFNQLQEIEEKDKINVTFLIAQIREQYYHSMKTILLRYGQILSITQSQIASEILEKGREGNVVIADDEEQDQQNGQQEQKSDQDEQQEQNDQLNVYSVLTILPSSSKLANKTKKMALSFIQKHKNDDQFKKSSQKLTEVLSSPKNCHLLVSSRLPNVPSFIICHSHQVFVQDLQQKSSKQKKTGVLATDYLLNISQVEVPNPKETALDDLIFSKFQDYQFCKRSLKWWIGEGVKTQRQNANLRRLYFVIKVKDYIEGVALLRGYLQDQEEEQVVQRE